MNAGRPARTRWLLITIVPLVAAAGLACAPTTRYQVLSFFFDGVPNPNAQPGNGLAQAVTLSEFRRTVAALPKARPRPAPPKIVSVHRPVAERQCRQCHDLSLGTLDVAPDARLCDNCHHDLRVREGWNHGPINLGTCVPCHKPHESIHPHLLEQPAPDLCLSCHTELVARNASYHQVDNFDQCVSCHNPHRIN
ncbi:MAG: hypothetical protein Kow0059_16090 [Candidatus Sumerlaeia bacterium]